MSNDYLKLKGLLKGIVESWWSLGTLLGLTKHNLEIVAALPSEPTSKLGKILVNWLSGDGQKATLSVLLAALHSVEGTDKIVVDYIVGAILAGIYSRISIYRL